jgi:hypothetical protein
MTFTSRHFFPLVLLLTVGLAAQAQEPRYADRWFYASFNLLVDKSADDLIALIKRAGKSGYNGMLLADYKFNILERMPDRYFKNVDRVKKAAGDERIEIIPAVFPIGYSNGLLAEDVDLAEGMPVTDAPFVVKDGVAKLVPNPASHIVNGDLERTKGDRFLGFDYQDDPGKSSFADHKVTHHGRVSCRMQDVGRVNPNGLCRLIQRVKVRPHACYRYSCWVRTRDYQSGSAFRLLAIGASEGGQPLTYYEAGLLTTQEWRQIEVVFNSLGESEVNLYAGQWGGQTGTLWLDDLKLEELALVNVLRRPGCPLVVTSADGKAAYEEGKDFLPVHDVKIGRVPWEGEYEFAHPGAELRLTSRSRIRNGERLRVSWYHPVLVHENQVMCCLTEPKVYEVLRKQAKQINDLFHPRTFFMSHDEMRVANWCASCQATRQTPGQLLAQNVRRCVEILRELSPKARIVVWSDLFDPQHNAVDRYYLVNGSLKDSWEGLPKDVIIANWNSGKAADSLRWFAGRGHQQIIAGFYDAGLDNLNQWEQAAKGVSGVTGFMYTTWGQNYRLLEAYGERMRTSK